MVWPVPVSKSKRSRYTPPPPKKAPPSSKWFVGLVLACFAIGVLIIIGNYIFMTQPSNWLLGTGLVLILVGFIASMWMR